MTSTSTIEIVWLNFGGCHSLLPTILLEEKCFSFPTWAFETFSALSQRSLFINILIMQVNKYLLPYHVIKLKIWCISQYKRHQTVSPCSHRVIYISSADISLADFGRKELIMAENEMPGLMHIRYRNINKSYTELTFQCIPSTGCLLSYFIQEAVRPRQALEGSQDRWLSAHDSPGICFYWHWETC